MTASKIYLYIYTVTVISDCVSCSVWCVCLCSTFEDSTGCEVNQVGGFVNPSFGFRGWGDSDRCVVVCFQLHGGYKGLVRSIKGFCVYVHYD
nr:hypothetical protein Iba_chr03dCG0470 [Ipomoea batatas]